MVRDKAFKIMVLTGDLAVNRTVTDALSRHAELVCVRQGDAVLKAAADDLPPATIIVDHATPQCAAIELFSAVRKIRNDIRRVLLTDYCDLSIIVQGLHTGAVQSIIYKPIHLPELMAALSLPPIAPLHAMRSVDVGRIAV